MDNKSPLDGGRHIGDAASVPNYIEDRFVKQECDLEFPLHQRCPKVSRDKIEKCL